MIDTSDLTPGELVHSARGHALDLGLVEAPDRTLHLPDCHAVRDRPSRPQRIPLEAIDCFPLCDWCLVQLNTPSLAAIVRLGPDIALLSCHAQAPTAAIAVALDGLMQLHAEVAPEFHPSLAMLGRSHHRLNDRALRSLDALLAPGALGGEKLRRSGLRMGLLEATAAVLAGHTVPEEPWAEPAARIVEAVGVDGLVSAGMLVQLAGWEGTRVVARPASQPEWDHVPAPPLDPARRLLAGTDLEPGSLEALTVELAIHDLLDMLDDLTDDLDQLDAGPGVRVVLEPGARLTPELRRTLWRRGRIHWLRGLLDLGLLGEVTDGGTASEVHVPPVIAAALSLPTELAGCSPVRACSHRVPGRVGVAVQPR